MSLAPHELGSIIITAFLDVGVVSMVTVAMVVIMTAIIIGRHHTIIIIIVTVTLTVTLTVTVTVTVIVTVVIVIIILFKSVFCTGSEQGCH